MVRIALIAVGALLAYALFVRLLGRSHPLSVFCFLGVAVFAGGLVVAALYGLVLLWPGSHAQMHDRRLWVWPSVWQDAGVAFSYLVIGMLLFLALIATKRARLSRQERQRPLR